MTVILASNSPRRMELLQQLGWTFEVEVPGVDEDLLPGTLPDAGVRELACRKALAAASRHRDAMVIAADTAVALDGLWLGKPRDEEDARAMLKMLSARTHQVFSGVCVVKGETAVCRSECTLVEFGEISDWEIDKYVSSGEPMDKAGAYGIQGRAAVFVKGIEGCFYNVMGLPLRLLCTLVDEVMAQDGLTAMELMDWQRH